jgi:hypothetical protein
MWLLVKTSRQIFSGTSQGTIQHLCTEIAASTLDAQTQAHDKSWAEIFHVLLAAPASMWLTMWQ